MHGTWWQTLPPWIPSCLVQCSPPPPHLSEYAPTPRPIVTEERSIFNMGKWNRFCSFRHSAHKAQHRGDGKRNKQRGTNIFLLPSYKQSFLSQQKHSWESNISLLCWQMPKETVYTSHKEIHPPWLPHQCTHSLPTGVESGFCGGNGGGGGGVFFLHYCGTKQSEPAKRPRKMLVFLPPTIQNRTKITRM